MMRYKALAPTATQHKVSLLGQPADYLTDLKSYKSPPLRFNTNRDTRATFKPLQSITIAWLNRTRQEPTPQSPPNRTGGRFPL